MINNHHHTCGINMPFGAWRFSLALKCIAGMMIMADCLPSPRNASYVWTDPFHVNVTWQRPGGLDSSKRCCYYVTGLEIKIIKDTFYKICVTTDEMADSGLNYTIATICRSTDQHKSSPVNVVIPRPPTLLKDVRCFLHSSSVMNCSWTWTPLGSSLPDMKVYYRSCDNLASSNLIACKNLYSNGCYLDTSRYRDDLTADICVLINGTLGGAPVWNTFRRKPLGKVRTRPPKVTMTAIGNQLGLSWTPQQDIQDTDACWNYIVSYSKCKEPVREVTESGLMLNITYDERCQYKVQVRATFLQSCGGEGGSDNSEAVMHGVDAPPDMSVMLAIIIPVLVSASLSVLACYCFRRHRAILWPMIPSPKVGTWIFKDLVENSKEQRTTKGNSYEPVEVDLEFCKICLVMDEGSPREGS